MSTWIGLDVECFDERWSKVNQLEVNQDAPHVTLGYLGKVGLSARRVRELADIVTRWCIANHPPFQYELAVLGYDVFANGGVFVLKVEERQASLLAAREQLVDSLSLGDFKVDETYSFVPHVSVGHGYYFHPPFKVEGMILRPSKLFVSYNGIRIMERKFL